MFSSFSSFQIRKCWLTLKVLSMKIVPLEPIRVQYLFRFLQLLIREKTSIEKEIAKLQVVFMLSD
jgi:hypothetical protein